MNAARRTVLGALGVLVLLALAAALAPRSVAAGHAAPVLGPLRELAAQWSWIRFQRARLAGQGVRALEFAERALDLDPHRAEGWEALADHLALDLASREREPDLERRRALFEAARTVLRRGRARSADPAALEHAEGLLCLLKAEQDPELDPEGAASLRRAALAALDRAAAGGHSGARELAALIRADSTR